MAISDYAHHNEDAKRIWWEEEGKHDQDVLDFHDMMEQDSQLDAMDAFYEEQYEASTEDILAKLADKGYCKSWPKAAQALRAVLADRGVNPVP